MRKRLTSVFTDEMETCYFTGICRDVARHHIFGGSNYHRKMSERYGFIVPVYSPIHNMTPYSIHENASFRRQIKCMAQRVFEEKHTREEFRSIFGQSFIVDELQDGYDLNLFEFGVPPELLVKFEESNYVKNYLRA